MLSKSETKCFWQRQAFGLIVALSAILLLPLGKTSAAAANESTEHYKMISTVEYTGKGQFKNQVESLLTVTKHYLLDNRVRYFVSTDDFDLVGDNPDFGRRSNSDELSFVIDRNTRHLSGGENLLLWETINNESFESLRKITEENVGQKWTQSFDLSFLGSSLPDELKFSMTAIQVKTEMLGEMIAVRALSEPFVVEAANEKGGTGPIKSSISAVYLFSPEIEDIYMSISVFEATTKINGFTEKLRREVATYKTDATGASVDFSGLDKKFEKLVRKLGLTRKSIKVVKESPLPQWALSGGLRAAQVANTYAAMACEGALNPVVTVCIPAARIVAMQCFGRLASTEALGSVSASLAKSVPGIGSMKIAIAPAIMGVGLGTAGAVAGGTVAIARGSSGSSRSNVRSP